MEHPGQEFKFYGRKLGERWHELSSEARQPFEAMAVADKKRFAAEFSSYQPAALYTQGKKLRFVFHMQAVFFTIFVAIVVVPWSRSRSCS